MKGRGREKGKGRAEGEGTRGWGREVTERGAGGGCACRGTEGEYEERLGEA